MSDERNDEVDKHQSNLGFFVVGLVLATMFWCIFVLNFLHHPQLLAKEVVVGRAIALLQKVKTRANLDKKVRIFVYEEVPTGVASVDLDSFHNELRIVTGRLVIEKFSDDALEGLIAHELGHYLSGHLKTSEQIQAEADAWVIKLSGVKHLESFLLGIEDSRLARRMSLAERVVWRESGEKNDYEKK